MPDPGVYALPADVEARMDALPAAGDREAVIETLFRELEAEDVTAFKAAPLLAGAHTITREIRAELDARLDAQQAAKITVPVLLLTGEISSDPSKRGIDAVAAALPNARIVVLEGQQHVADVLAPKVFARHLFAFLHGQR